MPNGWALYSTRGNRYKRMRQAGSYITNPLSLTFVHMHTNVHVFIHTHPHTLLHFTHTNQSLYCVPPLHRSIQLLQVTAYSKLKLPK